MSIPLVRRLGLACAVVGAAVALLGAVPTHAAPPRDLAPVLQPLLERSGLPALGAAVVTRDGLTAIGTVGVRAYGLPAPVTVDDQWHIGSCTKAMTATLVARLVEKDVLRWDTTLGQVFGPGIDPAWRDVTVLMLLSHRSGASRNFDDALWEKMLARGGTTREQRRYFAAEGLKVPPTQAPDTATSYSNAGVMLVGAMVEQLTFTSWEKLVQREVFGPLGMTRSGFGAPGTPDRLDQPLGHTKGDGVHGDARWVPVKLGNGDDNPAATGPAGIIHTTLGDWARFLAAHLRQDTAYLSAASWQRLHTAGGAGWEYTPGWKLGEADWAGGPVLHHLGSNGFWIVEASMSLQEGLGVLVVTNVADDAAEPVFKEVPKRVSSP